jgi:hypothetical protein
MSSRREQVWVGISVIIAAVVLIGVVLSPGAFAKQDQTRAYFRFASGLAPGCQFGGGCWQTRSKNSGGSSIRIKIGW